MTDLVGSPQVDDIFLSLAVTVRKYRHMEQREDRDAIAKFVVERFMERYLTPLKNVRPGDENGFLTMASCCLLIEGLTAFQRGWKTTKGKSEEAFRLFFRDEPFFNEFRAWDTEFYESVRCGILHQGETKCGWRLNFTDANAPLLETSTKRVNCLKFQEGVEMALKKYGAGLNQRPWSDKMWKRLRSKMDATIGDCEP